MEDHLYIVTILDGTDGGVVGIEYFKSEKAARKFIYNGPKDMGGRPCSHMRKETYHETKERHKEEEERAEYERLKKKYGD